MKNRIHLLENRSTQNIKSKSEHKDANKNIINILIFLGDFFVYFIYILGSMTAQRDCLFT